MSPIPLQGDASPNYWARLFRIACGLIRQVNARQAVIDDWSLGGGTAMMLQMGHRDSRDIDIFLSDAQVLAFLDPQKGDFDFEIRPDECLTDGARSLKLVFDRIGEIDFIVAGALTLSPTIQMIVEGEVVQVETVPEIVAKKVYYRGASVKPRDIFDIVAAAQWDTSALLAALRNYPNEVEKALAAVSKLNPEFVDNAIAGLAIRSEYRAIAANAAQKAKEVLGAALSQASSS